VGPAGCRETIGITHQQHVTERHSVVVDELLRDLVPGGRLLASSASSLRGNPTHHRGATGVNLALDPALRRSSGRGSDPTRIRLLVLLRCCCCKMPAAAAAAGLTDDGRCAGRVCAGGAQLTLKFSFVSLVEAPFFA